MKSLVINLDASTDRMERMAQVLEELELPYQRVPAIDGRGWSKDKITPFVSDTCKDFPNGGEIGCFLSHKRCWEIAANSDYDYTLILEDDAVPSADASVILRILGDVVLKSEIIYLEMMPGRTWIGSPILPVGSGHDFGRLRSDECGSAAYIVSREGAKKLLAASKGYTEPVDLWLFFTLRHRMRISAVRPGIFCQEMLLQPDLARAITTIGHPNEVKLKLRKSISMRISYELSAARNKLVRYFKRERRYRADFSRFL